MDTRNQNSFFSRIPAPTFPDDEAKTRKAFRLHWVSIIGIVLTIIYAAIYLFLLPEYTNRLLTTIPIIILFSFVLVLIRRGFVLGAAHALLFGLWVVITLVVGISGGTRAPFFGFYMVAVMSAVIFAGWRVATFYTGLSLLAGAIMVYLAQIGIIGEPFATPASALLTYTALLAFVIFDANVIVTDMKRSIQQSSDELSKRKRLEQALRDSEERYRLISTVTSDYTFSTRFDKNNNLEHLLLTGAFQEITGYTPEEYNARGGWRASLYPDDLEQDEKDMVTLRSNQKVISEVRTITKQGNVRWVRVYANPVWDDEANRLIGINGGVQDITEQKEAEATILNLNKELLSRATQLATLNEIAHNISVVTDLDSTLKQVLAKLQATIQLDMFYVALCNLDEDTLMFPLMYDSGQYWAEEPDTLRHDTWIYEVVQSGKSVLVNRTPEELQKRVSDHRRLGNVDRQSASIITAPLPIGDENIGIISIQSYTLNSYNEKHVSFLESAAYQIAIAIENARLYDSLKSELTERKRLEAELQAYNDQLEKLVDERTNALRRANEQLELVLNNTTNALAFADASGDIVIKNPAYRSTFHDEDKQSIETILWSIASDDQIEILGEALLKAIYDKERQQIEVKVLLQNGEEKDVDIALIPINMKDDVSGQGVLVSGHDITKLKEVERLKARFVADAVHDLATPISGMSTRLYLLKRSPEKLHDHVRAMENQVQHLKGLLEDLRTLSRMDRNQLELQMEKCNINDLVQRVFDTYEPVAIDKEQSLVFDAEESLPEANIDPRQIERVLVNLVSNAINYTPKQKTIRIETKGDSQALTVRVIDEGMGIASEDVPRVFDRFFRASKARDSLETGTGLGLAITKEIVELHEGSVSVTSEIGLGSTFTIQLPLNK